MRGLRIPVLLILAVGAAFWILVAWPWGPGNSSDPLRPSRHPAGESQAVVASAVSGDSGRRIETGEPGETGAEPGSDPETFELRIHTRWADSGQPAPRILVQVQEIAPAKSPPRTWSLESNERGEVFLPALGSRMHYRLQARRGPWEELVRGSGARELLHVLEVAEAFPLLVRVSGPDGVPIAAARVLVAPDAGAGEGSREQRVLGTTDEGGLLELVDVFGIAALTAQADSYSPAPATEIGLERMLAARRAGVVPELELRLGAGGGTLALLVRDVVGEPVEGARATLWFSAASVAGSRVPLEGFVTGPDGMLRVPDLLPSSYQLDVLHDRKGAWVGRFELWSGAEELREAWLVPHGEVEVHLAPGGVPWVGAAVTVRGVRRHLRGRTGSDGRLRIEGVCAGPVSLVATHAEGGRAAAEAEVLAGQVLLWEPELDARGTLAGVVLDSRGEPCVGWQVLAYSSLPSPDGPSLRQAFTDEQGSFRIVGCSFVAHSLEVRRDPIQPLPHGELQGVRPPREDLRIVVLDEPRAATLRGRVVGAELVGLAHLATRRRGSVDTGLWSLDPQDGSFEASSLAPGLHSLELWSQERSYSLGVEVELRAGEERDLGTLAVPAPAGLVVQLEGPAQRDPIRLMLVAVEYPSGLLRESAELRSGDRFEFEALSSGRYWVSAERRGVRLSGAEVDLVGGARELVRLEFSSHPAVHVLLEIGEPGEAYVQLRLLDGAGRVRCLSWYPALRGITFRLDFALPPGPYVCEIWGAGRLLERFETSVPEAPDPTIPLATWTVGG